MTVDGKTFEVEKGSHFILPHGLSDYDLSGDAEFIVSHV
ncbi:hypothetical protein [Aquibacillus saliphilus]